MASIRLPAYHPLASRMDAMAAEAAKAARADLLAGFRDFDDPQVYKDVYDYALDEHALGFVVQFGDNKAQVACGLGEEQFRQLLQQPSETLNGGTTPIRWINIWNAHRQRDVIEAIGEHYHFSRRLTMSIWAWDVVKMELVRRRAAAAHDEREHEGVHRIPAKPADGRFADILAPENLATFKMMQDNLNYTSMDQESKFVCVGANWLHRRPGHGHGKRKTPSLIPPSHWSWFVLCDDHTVITFHEAAYYSKIPKDRNAAEWKAEELKNMRSSTLKVLRQLSKCGLEEDRLKFMQLTSVRQPSRQPVRQTGRSQADDTCRLESSSNLFYYLFEDYSAALDVLNTSKAVLDDVSSRILHAQDWKSTSDMSDVIPLLYRLNKELRQLHHLFTNGKELIGRLLGSEDKDGKGGKGGKDDRDGRDAASDDGAWSVRGRLLSPKAANRFGRLQVQMQSLMLDAIADCLDERLSLQDTYFNLMTQKASNSTERLTRSATLLAKLSVFFLPISFMTSYFSVQIPHMTDGYTARTYWGAFGVIASISFLSLFFFSKVLMVLSERLDHVSYAGVKWAFGRLGRDQRKKRRMEEEDGY